MTARRAIALGFGALLLGLAAWQWWTLSRAMDAAAVLVGRMRPWVDARYESLWAWPAGSGFAEGVSARPGPRLLRALPVVGGVELDVPRLVVHEFRRAADGRPEFLSFSAPAFAVRLPSSDQRLAELPAPRYGLYPLSPAELGYDQLRGAISGELMLLPEVRALRVSLNLRLDDAAELSLDFELDTDASILERLPEDLALRFARLSLRDRGIVTRYRDRIAELMRVSPASAQAAIVQAFDSHVAEVGYRWDDGTRRALRRFLAGGETLRVDAEPLAGVALRDYPLYAPADWPVLLGLSARIEQTRP